MIEKPFPGWNNEWGLKHLARWVDEVTVVINAHDGQLDGLVDLLEVHQGIAKKLTERVEGFEGVVNGWRVEMERLLDETDERVESNRKRLRCIDGGSNQDEDFRMGELTRLAERLNGIGDQVETLRMVKASDSCLQDLAGRVEALSENEDTWEGYRIKERVERLERDAKLHYAGHDYSGNLGTDCDPWRPESSPDCQQGGKCVCENSQVILDNSKPRPKPDPEPADNQKGHFECDKCGRDWSDGRALFAERPIDSNRKTKTWWCGTYVRGCGAEAVTWHPDPPDTDEPIGTQESQCNHNWYTDPTKVLNYRHCTKCGFQQESTDAVFWSRRADSNEIDRLREDLEKAEMAADLIRDEGRRDMERLKGENERLIRIRDSMRMTNAGFAADLAEAREKIERYEIALRKIVSGIHRLSEVEEIAEKALEQTCIEKLNALDNKEEER